MKDTTIRNLDPEAYRALKARAAVEGRTIGEVMSAAIRCYLGQPSAAYPAARESLIGEVGLTRSGLDPAILAAVERRAAAEGRPVAEVLGDLVRRALEPRPPVEGPSGFPVFDVPAGAPPLTLEMVRRALDEDVS